MECVERVEKGNKEEKNRVRTRSWERQDRNSAEGQDIGNKLYNSEIVKGNRSLVTLFCKDGMDECRLIFKNFKLSYNSFWRFKLKK